MKSLAIYYKLRAKEKMLGKKQENSNVAQEGSKQKMKDGKDDKNAQNSQDELHVNIWKVNEGHINLKSCFYLDIGLKVSFSYDSVKLYLPFAIAKDNPIDLCQTIMEDRKLLCAIFNDEMLPNPKKNTCFCEVTSQANKTTDSCGKTNHFFLYQVDSNNIEVEFDGQETQSGTWITITMNGNPENESSLENYKDEQLYIRIRLKVAHNDQFRISESLSNDLIQAAFSRTDLFDLRINELREIDGKVLERMKTDDYSKMSFHKVHVFYITDTRETVLNSSSLKEDSRLLEKGLWLKYEPANSLYDTHYVAHHWKKNSDKDKDVDSFSVFFSTQYPKISIGRLAVYIFVIIFLGWSGSMLSFGKDELGYVLMAKTTIVAILFVVILLFLVKENIGFRMAKIYRKR